MGATDEEGAIAMEPVRVKRIYEPIDDGDGQRVLVDRLWPRGVSKARASLDVWMPEVAPSTELRQWFGHDPKRWEEFQHRYRSELDDNPHLDELVTLASAGTATLLYSARDPERNQAVALASIVEECRSRDVS